jgi:hypothetical protein
MKNYLYVIALSLFMVKGNAQTEARKWGMTIGVGNQQYHGYLGNGFYSNDQATYGVINITASHYLNKSFDYGVFGSLGDYGFCQAKGAANKEVPVEYRCKGCVGRDGMGNLSSRLVTSGAMIKYKFANDYLLSSSAKIKPYVYAGVAYNYLIDIMRNECVTPGNYYSLNAGIGCKYYLSERINIGCNVGLGCLPGKSVDEVQMGKNDMYLQNTVFLGIDLF